MTTLRAINRRPLRTISDKRKLRERACILVQAFLIHNAQRVPGGIERALYGVPLIGTLFLFFWYPLGTPLHF